jgi:hypothetical protein
MTATAAQLEAALTNFEDNMTKMDDIVNGDATTDIVLDSGTVPSITKLQSLMQGSLTATNFPFTAIAAQTTFVCTGSNIAGVNGVVVTADGVVQAPTAYTITGVDTVEFGSAPGAGVDVQVRVLGAPQSLASATADNVTYSQGSTGYSARTVEDKFQSESLSLLDFGADPTGAVSSAGALSSAMDAAMTLGCTLHIPAGTYLLSSWTVKATTARLDITADAGATLNCTASNARFVAPSHEFTMDGLTLTGFTSAVRQATTGGSKIEICRITNCRFETLETYYIYLRTPFELFELENCVFDGTGSTSPNNIVVLGTGGVGAETDYRSVQILNCLFQDLDCTAGAKFNVCDIFAETVAMHHNTFRNITHSGGAWESTILNLDVQYAHISDNVFETFTPNTSTPVSVIRLEGIERGGTLASSADHFGHTSVVSGNIINEYSSASTLYGIRFGIDEIVVSNNIMYNVLADTSSWSYGVFCNATATYGVTVTGNQVYGCRRGIYITADRALVIADNLIEEYSSYGIYCQVATGATDLGTLSGNIVADSGSSLSGGHGLRVNQGRWTVTGNQSYISGAGDYAMYISTNAAESVVSGNRLDGGASDVVQLLGSDCLIQGNIIVNGTINQATAGSFVHGNWVDGSLDGSPGVFAACRIQGWATPSVDSGSVNITGVSYDSLQAEMTINFTNSASNANYIPIITADKGGTDVGQPQIKSRTTSSFIIEFASAPQACSIVVHKF